MKKLREYLAEGNWAHKFADGEMIRRYVFQCERSKDTHKLGKMFEQAVRLDNHPSDVFNKMIRVGLIGVKGAGKTLFSDGLLAKDPDLYKGNSSASNQFSGQSPSLGSVYRVDFWERFLLPDYKQREARFSTQGLESGIELLEHAQSEEGDNLHVAVVFHKVVRSGVFQKLGTPRRVEVICEGALAQTNGFLGFLSEAKAFRI